MRRFAALILLTTLISTPMFAQQRKPKPAQPLAASVAKLQKELTAKYGENQRARLERGLKQVSSFWRPADGTARQFEEFVRANFAGDQKALDTMFTRFEQLFEQLDG